MLNPCLVWVRSFQKLNQINILIVEVDFLIVSIWV
jgi:hypothetical protein